MNRTTLAAAASMLAASALAQPVVMDWVTVRNSGNVGDPLNSSVVPDIGSVEYDYRIGTYEVTNSQYAAFLNSVAATDPNTLYSTVMGSSTRGGITRSGSDGSYTYSVRPNMGDKPVNFVTWFDAARMSNWMTNGQGVTGSGDTENGVYTFTDAVSISATTRNLNNPNQVFLPNEDEWYKAAYHQPASQGGDTDGYWLYATQSNGVPTEATATSIGDVANPGQNVVNYRRSADWNEENGNLTTVGSAGSTSFYGAFDMNGNVSEWNETLIDSSRGFRGGSYGDSVTMLRSPNTINIFPSFEAAGVGFRLASPVPGPGSCNPADLAQPLNVLDLADIDAFITGFLSGCP